MADTIRDVVVRLSLEQIDAQVKPPDFTPATTAVEKFEQTSVAAIDELEKEVESLREEIATMSGSFNEVGDSASRLADIQSAGFAAGEGLRTAGEGAFTLVRGMALVGISADTDLREFLERVAKIQGVFDAFKGGFEVTKGLIEGYKQLTVVAGAVASAQTTVATSSIAAAGGIRAVLVSLGPIGIALAAASAAYLLFTRNVQDNTDALDESDDTLDRIQERRRIDIESIRDIRRELLSETEQRNQLEKEIRRVRFQREAQPIAVGDPQLISVLEERERLLRRELDLQQELGTLLSRMSREEIRQQQESIRLLDQKISKERGRIETIEATLGRLNEAERLELRALARRAQGSGLGRAGLTRVEQLLPQARDFTTQQFARFGRQEFGGVGGEVGRAFGIEPSGLDELSRQREEATNSLEELNRAEQRFLEENNELIRAILERLELNTNRLATFRAEVERSKAVEQS